MNFFTHEITPVFTWRAWNSVTIAVLRTGRSEIALRSASTMMYAASRIPRGFPLHGQHWRMADWEVAVETADARFSKRNLPLRAASVAREMLSPPILTTATAARAHASALQPPCRAAARALPAPKRALRSPRLQFSPRSSLFPIEALTVRPRAAPCD